MSTLKMMLEALLFFGFTAGVLGLLGLGVVLWLSPEMEGRQLLLVPVVGLALLYVACQWLTPHISSGATLRLCLAVLGSFTLGSAFWLRARLLATVRRSYKELIAVTLAAAAAYLALLVPVFHARSFTLTETIGDGLFFYAPSASYLSAHAYAGGVTALRTPIEPALQAFQAVLYPGSMGTVDGAFSALTGRQMYQLLDLFNALCTALALVSVYVLVTGALGFRRRVAVVAVAVAATNQFLFWTIDWGHAQELRGSVLMLGALVFALQALRTGHIGAAVIAASIGEALLAVYMPIFALLAVAVGGALAVTLVASAVRRRWDHWPRVLLIAALTGAVLGFVNLRWLAAGGGLAAWQGQAFQAIPPGHPYGIVFPAQYLLSTAPIADLYRYQPLLFWGPSWMVAATLALCVGLGLALVGLVALVVRRRAAEAGMFAAVVAYTLYIRFGSTGVYGWTKIFSFVVPFVAILVAVGAEALGSSLGRWFAGRRSAVSRARGARRAARGPAQVSTAVPAGALLAVILALQVSATIETESMFIREPMALPPADIVLRNLPDVIPPGAHILAYDPALTAPGGATANTVLLRQALLFLVDRNVTLPMDGITVLEPHPQALTPRNGPLTPAEQRAFQYILEPQANPYPPPPAPAFRLVWVGAGLAVYRRTAFSS